MAGQSGEVILDAARFRVEGHERLNLLLLSQTRTDRGAPHNQEWKSTLNIKSFGRDISGTSRTQASGYPEQTFYANGLCLLF